MADPSLPPDMVRRIAALEDQVHNLTRSQNPVKSSILDLSDVTGVPTGDRLVMRYNRATGTWSAQAGGLEAGTYLFSASSIAPAGTVLCDGGLYFRTDLPDLFTAIGTTYGSTGGTNFRVPDYRDRFPIGVSSTKALGATGGSADAVVVSHSHTVSPVLFNGTTSHTHSGQSGKLAEGPNDGSTGTSASTATAGAGATNANMPPWLAAYVFIRT